MHTAHFPHFSFFILFIFHTPHFQYFSFSILLIFHTPHFPHSTFSILLIFQTPHFPFFDNKEGLSLGAELKPDSISQCKALQGIATHLKLRHFPTIGSLFLYRLIICEKKKKKIPTIKQSLRRSQVALYLVIFTECGAFPYKDYPIVMWKVQ